MNTSRTRVLTAVVGAAALAVAAVAATQSSSASPATSSAAAPAPDDRATAQPAPRPTTPIKHLVVIFDENVSFDHYFATYPHAANSDGTPFHAAAGTPAARTLQRAGLLHDNPYQYDPVRLTPEQAMTCDQNHNYGPEQQAFNGNAMNRFVQKVSVDTCTGLYGAPGLTMDYYDGNTVTAMWNYAQHYTLGDNFFGSVFGPSTPGAINLVSGNTYGIEAVTSVTNEPTDDAYVVQSPGADGVGTMINDPDPAYDDCSDDDHTSTDNLGRMHGRNIGDLLNAKGVSWGWFQGGFRPTERYDGEGTFAACGSAHANVGGTTVTDYSPHHNPFAYYRSTSNRHHVPPSSVEMVGHTDRAHHNYDLRVFNSAVEHGNLPSVSFLKAASYQDGHAGYSDPIDEQHFLVREINRIQRSPMWRSTAIVVAYDDSDGWYDHVASPLLNGSTDKAEDTAMCQRAARTVGVKNGMQDRCGPGPRLPVLMISPYAASNAVVHRRLEQTSVMRFIEENWRLGTVGHGSFENRAASLRSMLDFASFRNERVILNRDGSVRSVRPITARH